MTNQNVRYKPFHNQLIKPALADLMRELAGKVFSYWINDVLIDPKGHLFEVTLHIEKPQPDGQELWLPNWIPGSYLIRDFSKHIIGIYAEHDGRGFVLGDSTGARTAHLKQSVRAVPAHAGQLDADGLAPQSSGDAGE